MMNFEETTSSCNSCSSAIPENVPSDAIEGGREYEKGVYEAFSSDLHQKVALERIPTSGSIEIVENCNFRCIHCYQGMNKGRTYLSGDQWCDIIDQMAEMGTLWILLTGGEPLLHPDFEQIYVHLIKKGMLVSLFSNGAMMTEKHFDLFKKYPPFRIEFTLYGASEEMYQKITGTKNQFAKVRRSIERLIEMKMPLKLKSVAFNPLYKDIPAIKKMVEEEYGLEFQFDTTLDPTIYGDQLEDLRMSAEESVQFEIDMIGQKELSSDFIALYDLNDRNIKSANSRQKIYKCGAGRKSFYIDYKGGVNTCSTGRLNEPEMDLTRNSFKHIWDVEFPKIINKQYRNKNAVCHTCEYQDMCDQCPATSFLATGDHEGRPLYICQRTMERKKRYYDERNQFNQEG